MTPPNNQVVNANRNQGNRTDSIHQVSGKAKRHSLYLVQQDEERLRQEVLLVAKEEEEVLVAKAQQEASDDEKGKRGDHTEVPIRAVLHRIRPTIHEKAFPQQSQGQVVSLPSRYTGR